MLGGMVWAAIPAHPQGQDGRARGRHHDHAERHRRQPGRVGDQRPAEVRQIRAASSTSNLRTDLVPRQRARSPTWATCFGDRPIGASLVAAAAGASSLRDPGLVPAPKRMRLGYEARAVGASPGSARAGGISHRQRPDQALPDLGRPRRAGRACSRCLADQGLPAARTTRRGSGSLGSRWRSWGRTTRSGIMFAAIMWARAGARARPSLQIETSVPREFIIILQGILILSVVVIVPGRQAAAVRAAAAASLRGAARLGMQERTSRTSRPRRPPDAVGDLGCGDRASAFDVLHDHLPHRAWAACSASARAS